MLLEFSVENFLSIKERETFSMFSLSEDDSLPYNCFTTKAVKDEKILKSAIIFGANASGKTNLLKSLQFIVKFIRNSHKRQKGDLTGVIPFKMSKDCLSKPSSFEITFAYENIKYTYSFKANKDVILEESLYYYPNDIKSLVFDRKNIKNFTFGLDHEEQNILSSRTLENILYLSSSTQWNYEKTSRAFEWFIRKIEVFIDHDQASWREYTAEKISEKSKFYHIVRKILSKADVGITDIISTVIDCEKDDNLLNYFEDKKNIQITTFHNVGDGNNLNKIKFDFNEESEGTKKLFDLLGPIIDILENGKTLVIDELDLHLHSQLVRSLIELFHTPETNPHNAQLIFSTHNSNLLNLNIFRRDQIWFTEKNPNIGATELYSLGDFDYVENENIEKGYLAGRFGAIPVLEDFNSIFSKENIHE
ncbi:MAG: ATP-binding protein [Halanaerobiales bacterium]|nr:ATP-binding protein [Halanaerobiales bacterium]